MAPSTESWDRLDRTITQAAPLATLDVAKAGLGVDHLLLSIESEAGTRILTDTAGLGSVDILRSLTSARAGMTGPFRLHVILNGYDDRSDRAATLVIVARSPREWTAELQDKARHWMRVLFADLA